MNTKHKQKWPDIDIKNLFFKKFEIFTGKKIGIFSSRKVVQPYFHLKTCRIVTNNKCIPDKAVPSEPQKKVVKILKTRLQSSKNAQKLITNCKIRFFNTFFQGKFMVKLSIFFYKYFETTFSKQFCPIFFNVFCAKVKDGTQKAIENRTPV